MSNFQLDTSGAVLKPVADIPGINTPQFHPIQWTDLTPFQQGAVGAALREVANGHGVTQFNEGWRAPRFSDLAPATLARIMWDCERLWEAQKGRMIYVNTQYDGALFWGNRKGPGMLMHYGEVFLPLTLYLGGDGLIYAKETGQ